MRVFERVAGRLIEVNNGVVRRADPTSENPRSLDRCAWHDQVAANHALISGEWDDFSAAGEGLPLIEDLIAEDQGNEGPWRAGLLFSAGVPREPLARCFPHTIAVLAGIPGLRSALWSVLSPGTVLPEHSGPNAGVLRYHLGVRCGTGAALRVGDVEVPYRDGEGILFDDTVPHAAWNRGSGDRVTLFCEILRPVDAPARWLNTVTQAVIGLDRRYRDAPRRAAEWAAARNAGMG